MCRTSARDNIDNITYNITYYFLSLKNVTFWVSKRGGGSLLLNCLQVNTLWVYLTSARDKHVLRKAEESRGR